MNNLSNWMINSRETINQIELKKLALPGTHNSGSYRITENSQYSSDFPEQLKQIQDKLSKPFIAGWSKTQEKTIFEQLSDGIRYFDLRVDINEYDNNKFYLTHAMFSLPLDCVLKEIKDFVNQPYHDKEIIILDLQKTNRASASEVCQYIINRLDENKFIPNTLNGNSKINEFWEIDRQIILLCDIIGNNINIWLRNENLFSPYNEDQFHDTDSSFNYIKEQYPNRKEKQLFVLQGICTPDIKTYLTSFVSPESPEIQKKKEELPFEIEELERKKEEYQSKLDNLEYYIPSDWDDYFKFGALLASTIATLETKKAELLLLKNTTAPGDLSVYAKNINKAVDKSLFTAWNKNTLNIVMIDYYNSTDIIEDILQNHIGTPNYIQETNDDIPGFKNNFDYDHQSGYLFLSLDNWRNVRGFSAAIPHFEFNMQYLSFTVLGNESARCIDVKYRDIGLKRNVCYYNGNNKSNTPGEAIRLTHRWAIANGYTTGFPNFQANNDVMGVIGLYGELVELRDVNYKEIGLNNTADYYDKNVGNAIRLTHEWAIKNGFETGFPNFEGWNENMGVVIIKKRPLITAPRLYLKSAS